MAVLAIADDVHHHIASEFLPKIQCHLDTVHGCHRIVAVHVKDRHVQHLGRSGAVKCGPRIVRQGGESDLVVDDDVNRATSLIAVELRHVKRLCHNALPDECSVTMDHHRQNLLAILRVVEQSLESARLALHYRRHCLKVARVWGEVNANLAAIDRSAGVLKPEMVLHIPITVGNLLHIIVTEFVEQELVVLANNVGQYVESATVRHAHRDLENPPARRRLNNRIEHRNQSLTALKREPLLPYVTGVQKFFKLLGFHQTFKDTPFFVARITRPVACRLHPVTQPASDLKILDVHVLRPNRSTVGFLQDAQNFPERLLAATPGSSSVELLIEIRLRELEIMQIQLRQLLLVEAQRVEVGDVMP